MNSVRLAALVIIIASIVLGAALGLLVPSEQPSTQKYYFSSSAVYTQAPSQCLPISKNYSYWLGIDVIGNRTQINFQSATVFSASDHIRLDLPLNDTTSNYVAYKPVNSSFEIIYVPLPNYFRVDETLQISLSYFVTGYSLQTVTLTQTPIRPGSISC